MISSSLAATLLVLTVSLRIAILAAESDTAKARRSERAAPDIMCPRNMEPYLVSGQPRSCVPGNATNCPQGYFCNRFLDITTNREEYVCCGKSPGYCQNGEVYKDPLSGAAKECQVGQLAQCPSPFQCRSRVSGSLQGFCCMDLDSIEPPPIGCPWGTRALQDANGNTLTCTPGKPNACPGTAVCYFDSVEATNKCCGKDPGEGCPRGSKPQRTNNQLVTCRPGVPSQSCPGTGVCQWSYLIDRYQCCEADNGCPDNMVPLVTANGVVQTCQAEQLNTCQTNFQCSYNFWTGTYQCCGQNLGNCPVGQVPYREPQSNLQRACPGGVQTLCPTGYTCQPSTTNSFLCCGTEGQCPLNTVATRSTDGRAVSCSISVPTSCQSQANAVCQVSTGGPAGQALCCSNTATGSLLCSGNRAAQTVPGTTQPQQCTLGIANTCNPGFQCELSSSPGIAICCSGGGVGTQLTCPSNLYTYTVGGQPQLCTPNTCQGGYTCLQAIGTSAGQLVCCGATPNEPRCPIGFQAETIGTAIKFCNPSTPQVCTAPTYSCQSAQPANFFPSQFICCTGAGSGGSSDVRCNGNLLPDMIGASPRFCSVGVVGSCLPNYDCQQAINRIGLFICCPIQSAQTSCPAGYSPNLVGGSPQQCTLNVPNNCLSPYQCTQAANRPGFYICCSFTGGTGSIDSCPSGQQLLYVGGQVQYCSGVGAVCPQTNYICQQSPTTFRFVCCGSTTTTVLYQCADGRAVWAPSNQPYYCLIGANQCPQNYECATSTAPGRFVCCLRTNLQQGRTCASGRSAYLTGGVQPYYCSAENPSCPETYSCELSDAQSQYLCCFTGTTNFRCPTNWTPYRIGSDPQTCVQSNPGICPIGHSCIQSTKAGTFVCCRPGGPGDLAASPAECNDGARPFVDASGEPRFCTVNGFDVCPGGYSCQASTKSNTYVCCQGRSAATDVSCPSGMNPLVVNAITRTCQTNADCPPAYTCIQSFTSTTFLCCKSGTSSVSTSTNTADVIKCKNGANPFYETGNRTRFCTLGASNSGCPSGFACSESTMLGDGMCCEQLDNQKCINGQSALLERSGQPKRCSLYQPSDCPSGYVCQQAATGSFVYYCCDGPRCPNGLTPTLNQGTDQPRYCQPRSTTCPTTATCQEAANIPGSYICCQPPVDPSLQCTGRATLRENGRAVLCSLPNTCATGYECTSLSTTGQRICCSLAKDTSNNVCPGSEEAYVDDLTNGYLYCSQTGYACPKGYLCKQMINSDDNYICCKASAMCQRGWLPYVDPSTNKPKSCNPSNAADCKPPGAPYKCQLSTVPQEYLCCMESLIQWELLDNKTSVPLSSQRSTTDTRTTNNKTTSMTFEEFFRDLWG